MPARVLLSAGQEPLERWVFDICTDTTVLGKNGARLRGDRSKSECRSEEVRMSERSEMDVAAVLGKNGARLK